MRAFALALSLTLTCTAPSVLLAAEPDSTEVRDEARQHGAEGISAYQEGRWSDCVVAMQRAEALLHAPAHLLYTARCQVELKQILDAHRTYVRIVVEEIPSYAAPAFHQAQTAAGAELAALRDQISGAELSVQGAPIEELTITLDGQPLPHPLLAHPLALEPGEHLVEIIAPDYLPLREQLQIDAGIKRVELTLQPTPPAPLAPVAPPFPAAVAPPVGETDGGAPLLVPGAVLLGVGGAALIAAGVLGALTLSQASDIKESCNEGTCPTALEPDANDAKTLGTTSTVLFIAGGVLAATGVVFMLIPGGDGVEPADTAQRIDLGLRLGPTALGVIGHF